MRVKYQALASQANADILARLESLPPEALSLSKRKHLSAAEIIAFDVDVIVQTALAGATAIERGEALLMLCDLYHLLSDSPEMESIYLRVILVLANALGVDDPTVTIGVTDSWWSALCGYRAANEARLLVAYNRLGHKRRNKRGRNFFS